jgi:hypothetical protein
VCLRNLDRVVSHAITWRFVWPQKFKKASIRTVISAFISCRVNPEIQIDPPDCRGRPRTVLSPEHHAELSRIYSVGGKGTWSKTRGILTAFRLAERPEFTGL